MQNENSVEEVIITVVGKNRVGVLAEVTTTLANLNADVLDISQKMLRGYFNLIMVVDIAKITVDFAGFKAQLETMGDQRGYQVNVQHERVFQYMHRI